MCWHKLTKRTLKYSKTTTRQNREVKMFRRSKKLEEHLRIHAKRRAFQRYNIMPNDEELDVLVKRIQERQQVTFVERQSDRVTVWDLDVLGTLCRVAYDGQRKMISTFLPPHVLETEPSKHRIFPDGAGEMKILAHKYYGIILDDEKLRQANVQITCRKASGVEFRNDYMIWDVEIDHILCRVMYDKNKSQIVGFINPSDFSSKPSQHVLAKQKTLIQEAKKQGLEINEKNLADAIVRIQNQEASFVRRQSDAYSVWDVEINGTLCRVLYRKNPGCISRLVPK